MRTVVLNSYVPKVRDYFNTIVVDNDNSVQYIFDCDGVYTVYPSGVQFSIVVDSELKADSTNPVENRAIYEVIGDIETILTTLTTGEGV